MISVVTSFYQIWGCEQKVGMNTHRKEIWGWIQKNNKISSSSYQSLMAASYNDLRHDEVLTASFDDITSMDISLDGSVYTITAEGKGEDTTFHYNAIIMRKKFL